MSSRSMIFRLIVTISVLPVLQADAATTKPLSISASIDTIEFSESAEVNIEVYANQQLEDISVIIVESDAYTVLSQPASRLPYLDPGNTALYAGSLRADQAGTWQVEVWAYATVYDSLPAAANDYVVVYISDTLNSTMTLADYVALFGSESDVDSVPPEMSYTCEDSALLADPYAPDSLWDDDTTSGKSGTFSVRGFLSYHDPCDPPEQLRAAVNVTVEVWDSDGLLCGGDDRIAVGITNSDGYFEINGIPNGDCSGTADPYVRFVTCNSDWGVKPSPPISQYYTWMSNISYSNVADNSMNDFGNAYIMPGSPYEGAMWAYQYMRRGWELATASGASPGFVRCEWPCGSNYASGGNIFIEGSAADAADIVNHEYGHAMMQKAYDGWWPEDCCPDPHHFNQVSCPECAWTEGWASFVALAATPDGTYDWEPTGYYVPFEHTIWITHDGPSVAGQVVAALYDLWDTNDDNSDQNSDYPITFAELWSQGVDAQTDNNFEEFWNHVRDNVITKPQSYRGIKSIQQNTIESFTGAMRGDCNADDIVNVSDAVYMQAHIFGGGPPPVPYTLVGDTDCNEIFNISDQVYLIAWMFGEGPAPCTFE